ncbi:MAG: ADP-ribosylglycohydrolase family protein [Desulfovibrio sp.]|nr:ADP-ribosylglycohydrolase family protein [Desulfovibrio sp.]
MFETLTALLPMLEKTKPDQWIVAGSDNGTDGDGQPDLMPCYVYGPGARQLMEAIGRCAHEHGELKLYDYPRILQEAGLWESPDKADVSTLDGRGVAALLFRAVRAERFCDGAFLSCLERGLVIRWLQRLRDIDSAGDEAEARTGIEASTEDQARLGATLASRTAMAQAVLLGLACGDALGVPVEFKPRGSFKLAGMQGWGTHHQPPGTWSDDTSLALALAASLVPGGFDVRQAGRNFQDWLFKGRFTPFGTVFDAGATTANAIARMRKVPSPDLAGGTGEYENGNGSLMRIAPLALPLLDVPEATARYEQVRKASSLTHAHPLSCACCFVFVEYLLLLARGLAKEDAYRKLCVDFARDGSLIAEAEARKLATVLKGRIPLLPRPAVQSGGYVLHTLEASLWCLLTTESYADAVLKAVNLGGDTDTTGAVAGALAGMCYGVEGIPSAWLGQLVKAKEIARLARRATQACLKDSKQQSAFLS